MTVVYSAIFLQNLVSHPLDLSVLCLEAGNNEDHAASDLLYDALALESLCLADLHRDTHRPCRTVYFSGTSPDEITLKVEWMRLYYSYVIPRAQFIRQSERVADFSIEHEHVVVVPNLLWTHRDKSLDIIWGADKRAVLHSIHVEATAERDSCLAGLSEQQKFIAVVRAALMANNLIPQHQHHPYWRVHECVLSILLGSVAKKASLVSAIDAAFAVHGPAWNGVIPANDHIQGYAQQTSDRTRITSYSDLDHSRQHNSSAIRQILDLQHNAISRLRCTKTLSQYSKLYSYDWVEFDNYILYTDLGILYDKQRNEIINGDKMLSFGQSAAVHDRLSGEMPTNANLSSVQLWKAKALLRMTPPELSSDRCDPGKHVHHPCAFPSRRFVHSAGLS